MKLDVTPLPVGAELRGWNFDQAPDEQSVSALRQALLQHHMLLIREKKLSPSELLAFARLFGSKLLCTGKDYWHSPEYPQVFRLTNQPTQLEGCACESWHCDGHYMIDPCAVTVSNMVAVGGGAISVCDLYHTYDRMPDRVKQAFSRVRCLNSGSGVIQPLVRRHPATGRVGLYINMYANAIDPQGNRLPLIDGLLDKLLAQSVYKHEWQLGDIMILDNFAVTHKVCPADPAKVEVLQRSQTVESGTWWRAPEVAC